MNQGTCILSYTVNVSQMVLLLARDYQAKVAVHLVLQDQVIYHIERESCLLSIPNIRFPLRGSLLFLMCQSDLLAGLPFI